MPTPTKTPNRRLFIELLTKWAAAGAALVVLPGCGGSEEIQNRESVPLTEENNFGMHGPIEQATHWLKKPLEKDAVSLLEPYHQGQVFVDRWSFVHATRGSQNQVVLIVVDLETTGHVELHLFDSEVSVRPLALSDRYALILNDNGDGDKITPPHVRYLAEDVADLLRTNEHRLQTPLKVPRFNELKPFIEGDGPHLHRK